MTKFPAISEHLNTLDGRDRETKTALADRTTHLIVPSSSQENANNVTTATASTANIATTSSTLPSVNLANNDDLIPSTDFLKSDRAIQQQVDARFLQLQGAANLLNTG